MGRLEARTTNNSIHHLRPIHMNGLPADEARPRPAQKPHHRRDLLRLAFAPDRHGQAAHVSFAPVSRISARTPW